MNTDELEYVRVSIRLETAFRRFGIEDYPPRGSFVETLNEAIQCGLKALCAYGSISREVVSNWLEIYSFGNMSLKEALTYETQRQKIENLLNQLEHFSRIE